MIKWEVGDMYPHHEMYFHQAIQVLRALPSKSVLPISKHKRLDKYDDIRSMTKGQLRDYIAEYKHSGYHKRLRMGYYKGKDNDVLIGSRVLYARNRLWYAFHLWTRLPSDAKHSS